MKAVSGDGARQAEPPVPPPTARGFQVSTQILASGVVKTYGSNTVVKDLDLQIEQGEFLVLLGPSGCGKTTTLRCLAGLETADEGAISFGDRAVFDAARRVNV